jgi:hypothetical protein
MSHCVPHSPLLQIWPLPQAVPFKIALNADVLALGWQLSQGSFGSAAFVA